MRRSDFAHALRAAGAVLGVDELLVIGSQALHASCPDPLPPEAGRSIEADIAVPGDEDGRLADLLDGSLGEASMFHEAFGYYVQGVVEATPVLPAGWRERLVRFEATDTDGVVGWCLEVNDLWLSKACAGREKDDEFCRALLRDGLVDPSLLRGRLPLVDGLLAGDSERVGAWIDREAAP